MAKMEINALNLLKHMTVDIGRGPVPVRVKWRRLFAARLAAGLFLVRLGFRLAGAEVRMAEPGDGDGK